MSLSPDPDIIQEAHNRVSPWIHRTPVFTSASINEIIGASLWFKCENFQKVGAFKSRGAVNAVFSLSDAELANGVCTHSSGNHAQALARAALLRGIPAHIVMPENAPAIKVAAVKHYKGNITFCKPTLQAREESLAMVRAATGATEIHPYNHPPVILGQATCAKELIEDIPVNPDYIITPVGGGGLLSGTCLSVQCYSPDTVIIAAEPEGANDAWQSMKAGELIPSVNPNTIADGLLTSLGSNTWPVIRKYVREILLADDRQIVQAMRLIWERMKIITEPSAVLPLAALIRLKENGDFEPFKGKHIAIILSGGNIDLDRLPWNMKTTA
ncbi:MAG: pyridoxal-phosphate dependent enzyme [Bacteroidales bacterium]